MTILRLFRGGDGQHLADSAWSNTAHDPSSAHPSSTKPMGTCNTTSSLSDINIEQLPPEERAEKEISVHPDEVTENAQAGVKKAEAVALVWSKTALYSTYAWIWACFFILQLQSSVSSNVIYYAYGDFASAPQISQAFIVASVVGGVLQLPIAKILNLWGRAEGYLVLLAVLLIGLVVLASSRGPTSFAVGYSLYTIGFNTVTFILGIFIVDSSGLRNRAFAYAFTGAPNVATAFLGPLIAEGFILHSNWRWSYGAFAFTILFVLAPLALVFKFYQRKARKLGLLVKTPSGRTAMQSVVHYFHEFDFVGAFLLTASFLLFLLPFSLEIYGFGGYGSATFITLVVIGALLLPAFAAWERFFAKTQFIKWELFKKRTVMGASVLAAVIFFNWYVWEAYFYYYVMVVYNLDTARTGYVTSVYGIGSAVWGVVFGVWIRQTRHFKWTCLFFGAPVWALGAGLMIYFRGNAKPLGYLILSQVILAIGGGTLVIGDEMAVMAAADRDGVPMLLALLGLFSSLGGAIGNAAASAIYTNTFPQALLRRLPSEAVPDLESIYLGGSATQLLYPPGTPVREAIDYAWAQSQLYLCIAAAASTTLAFPAIAVWKNYNVDRRQVKGTVI